MKLYFDMNIYNRVFDDLSLDEIFDNAKKHWESR